MSCKVAIVIPVYNAATHLAECLDSVFGQTYTEFTVFTINDGSTDSSETILREYQTKYSNLEVISLEKNIGLVSVLNYALKNLLISYDYMVRMDADDIMFPDRIETQINYLETHSNVDVCSSSIVFFGQKSFVQEMPSSHEEIECRLLINACIPHPASVIRLSFLYANKMEYPTSIKYAQDYYLFSQMLENAKFYNFKRPLLRYRWHDQNISVTKKAEQENTAIFIRQSLFKRFFPDISPEPMDLYAHDTYPQTAEFYSIFATMVHKMLKQNTYFNSEILHQVLMGILNDLSFLKKTSFLEKKIHYLKKKWLPNRSNLRHYVTLKGGLGNQLFQYAFGQYLKKTYGVSISYNLNFYDIQQKRRYELDLFMCNDTLKSERLPSFFKSSVWQKKQKLDYVYETGFHKLESQSLSFEKPLVFEGYWQSYLFLDSIRPSLLTDFSFKTPPSESTLAWLDKYKKSTLICLHIRRGDYVSEASTNAVHGVLPISYYNKAITKFKSALNPVVFVFTDDPQWAKKNLTLGITTEFISNKHRSMKDDFELMQACHKFIIANSTFSWWASYLSEAIDKEVIYPDPWFLNSTKDTRHLCPPEWIAITYVHT